MEQKCIPLTLPTFSGKSFSVIDPQEKDICIEDIAHGLSNVCRYSGQCPRFYSVAEHSYLMTIYALANIPKKLNPLSVLLHDGSEAYIADMPNYIKGYLPTYKAFEEDIMIQIGAKFNCSFDDPRIKELDLAILKTEIMDMFRFTKEDFLPDRKFLSDVFPLPIVILNWNPEEAEKNFLGLYETLTR
jgi:hypothetical protein